MGALLKIMAERIYTNDRKNKIYAVQFHPEACGGPHDTSYLFDEFIQLMEGK